MGLWRDGVKVTCGFSNAVLPVRVRAPASILKGVSFLKKKFVSLVLCMALLSSFTVSASAYDVNDIYNELTAIRNELGYPQGNWSSLRRAVNYIADHMPDSSPNYSTVLSNIYSNTSSISSTLSDIYGVNSGLVQRVIEIQSKIDVSNQHLGTISSTLGTIDSHIGSGFELVHSDFTFLFDTVFDPVPSGLSTPQSSYYRYPIFLDEDGTIYYGSFGNAILFALNNLTNDRAAFIGGPTLFHIVHQLQQVLASDDDLQLKQDNKANEDAATDAFVNGNSSNTSLGPGDFGNLKDVGGTFNDLTSLNGQSSVSSFLSGLTSADGTGQGWFSEATRASLDAVSAPVTTTRLVQKHWRGEKSLTYSISADTSVNVVSSPAPACAPAADPDPYNMSGFVDNYNWLWGDAS